MATIRDVAKLAGVSTATVSHVLNNTRPVSSETREVVLEAIDKLHYRPSAIARSLTTRITHTAGVLVADIANPFFAEIVRRIEKHLAGYGYNLIVCNTDEEPEREARYLKLLYDRRIDGAIIASTGANLPIYRQYVEQRIPLIFFDRYPPQPYGTVITADNYVAGYIATRHLIQLGHQEIAIIARYPTLSTTHARLEGYRAALNDHGLPVREDLIVLTNSRVSASLEAASALLARPQRPTGLIAANHIMALGLLQAVREADLACPQEISLVCFDDQAWAPLFTPPLTVVAYPIAKLSDTVVNVFLSSIRQCQQPLDPKDQANILCSPNIRLEAELIVRGSTGPAPTRPEHGAPASARC
jgi:LacI family transcriptional regulator